MIEDKDEIKKYSHSVSCFPHNIISTLVSEATCSSAYNQNCSYIEFQCDLPNNISTGYIIKKKSLSFDECTTECDHGMVSQADNSDMEITRSATDYVH